MASVPNNEHNHFLNKIDQETWGSCQTCDEYILFDERYNCHFIRIKTWHWNDHIDDFDYIDIGINFCPECGKKYENLPLHD